MKFALAVEDLERIGRSPVEALNAFAARRRVRGLRLLRELHLPLLLSYPVAALLCPYSWIASGGPSLSGHLAAPLVLVALGLVQAMLFDRVLEYAGPRPVEFFEEPDYSQLALQFHLPLSAAGVFFVLHPALGYIMLLASLVYSVVVSIRMQCAARGLSLARALGAYVSAATLPLAGLAVLLVFWNLSRTLTILRGLD